MSGIFDQIINYSPPLIVSGTVNYKGTWNASTNNPTLNSSPASSTKGDYYVVSTAGTQFGITFAIGDWIISNGTAWEKVDLTDAVSSVFGRTGAVVGVSTDYSAVGLTNTAIGASNPSTGAFTTVTASSTISATGAVTGSNLSGTNTGDQTTITGNAGTATALQTARTIGGSSFDGTANVTSFPVPGAIGVTTPAAANFTSIGVTTQGTGAFTTLSASGNLNFTGTANRITGDFSNATFANRVAFQSSTTNSNTGIFILPNGTAPSAAIRCANNSDPTNAAFVGFDSTPTEVRVTSGITGTGTYLPMTFYTGGSERMRIDTSGNTAVTGALSASGLVTVQTAAGTAAAINLYAGNNTTTSKLNIGQVGSIDWDLGVTTTNGWFQIGGLGGTMAQAYTIARSGTGVLAHTFYTGGAARAEISSTGLAVTGALSSTSDITIGAAGNLFLAGNFAKYIRANTGSSADLRLGGWNGVNIEVGSGFTNVASFSSTGLAVTGQIASISGGADRTKLYASGTKSTIQFGSAAEAVTAWQYDRSLGTLDLLSGTEAALTTVRASFETTGLTLKGNLTVGVSGTGTNIVIREYSAGTQRNWGIRDDAGVDRLRFSRGASDYWFWDSLKVAGSDNVDVQNWRAVSGFNWTVSSTIRTSINSTGLAVTGTLTTSSTTLHTSSVSLTNGAAAALGTLTNAPVAGNPTKWIPIVDNGVTRYIPCW